ncbi:NAD(P)H-quinone oxidoreductase subunit F [Anthocerotibacter panamensis]|uniref:NAD(P)H-quinone oxidoreductase subunit F n=1 Tax=Anthocerotibacter panamensis TaxID=2857077 RepID=UPI001C4016AF|nr:NAD(P)H-quinone oxidoreductase subunit F [Anthocerotibacter panamensis]
MEQSIVSTLWWIPCYGLVGAVLALPWFPGIIRRTGPRPSGYINLVMTLLAFGHSVLALLAIWKQPPVFLSVSWLKVANLDLTIPLEVSAVTVGALVLVTGLNLLAQVYAVGYMEMDWGWARLFALLGFFEAGMCALVLCNSLFFSYFILELLTLGTYLLVGFWFNQPLVVTGARDAFLTKRVGDLLLLMGVLALWPLAGTWTYPELAQWAATANLNPTVAALLGLALMAGPIGKCAQFPLHLWLDEAMEGPLPSTILRNSVVVATGAWVLVKLYPVLALSPVVLIALIVIGGISAMGGVTIALAQLDVKRALSFLVTAYMGLVFIAVGTHQFEAALLLVLTHALAMALLVMSAGSVIWNSITQDLSRLGGLWSRRPMAGLSFLVGAAGLVALPPLGGFWALLELATGLGTVQPWLVGVVLWVNTLSAFGLARVFGLIFTGKPHQMSVRSPESPWPITLPMLVLAGFVLHLPLVLQYLGLFPSWSMLNLGVALLLLGSSVLGLGAGLWLKPVELPWKAVQDLLANDFYTAQVYRMSIVLGVNLIARLVALFDRYIVDGLVNLVGQVSILGGEALKYSNSGRTQFYLLTLVVGIIFLAAMVLWPTAFHLA